MFIKVAVKGNCFIDYRGLSILHVTRGGTDRVRYRSTPIVVFFADYGCPMDSPWMGWVVVVDCDAEYRSAEYLLLFHLTSLGLQFVKPWIFNPQLTEKKFGSRTGSGCSAKNPVDCRMRYPERTCTFSPGLPFQGKHGPERFFSGVSVGFDNIKYVQY